MTVRGNLPAQTTTFIGRRAVLADTEALLGRARLVTLAGPGGVGKTRIAVETGRALAQAFQHGAWRVRLGDLNDPAALARTVATQLRIVDNAPEAGLGRLVESLYDKHLLLVLDNCEHLLEAVRHLVHHLLRDCEGLTILATSREPLGVYGEHLLRVPALGLDDAVLLFEERAEVATNLTDVTALCEGVDGLPLAVELLAAQPGGVRSEVLQHAEPATLEQVLEWSARQCTDEERRLWAQLSVFPADFDLAAAEAVADADVLKPLSALVLRSIVTTATSPVTGETRYRLLDTVSQFGARLLTNADEPLRRHAVHYSGFVAEAARSWFSPGEARWMGRLWEEWPNIRAAVGHALRTPDLAAAGAAVAMNVQRVRFTSFAGMLGQAWDLLMAAREVITEAPLRTSLLAHCAYMAQVRGDSALAFPLMNEARALPRLPITDVHLVLAEATHLFFVEGSPDCVPLYAHVVELCREHSSPGDTYITELMHAMASCFLLDAESADKATTALARQAESNGVSWAHAWGLWHRGLYELLHGDPAQVHPLAIQALRIQLTLGDSWSAPFSLWLLACTCAELGANDRAARLLGALRSQERISRISFSGMSPFRRLLDRADRTVRRSLGDDYQVITTLGADLRPEQVMAFALEPVPDSERRPVKPLLPGGLSRQEFTIAGLVADGFTSKQIAARLYISPRTADRHVVNIRVKLGLPNRMALAAWHRSTSGER
ncbi:LuxR C-terminal-related transcriptional regulator [Lentzea sp. BCCO 10_0061]|uniref:LuxR C-terminal-related transcriptional regulator n=1 Tax=Lentzea sokolovensis TaxID=3095429 RepID=A0ABU4UZL4_9PSEU|nr:LuxR C-terminal-related transcriptional regulator [Lentzea sp. BCCO 10_0061]MDX8144973.1 LuxR C-terminal-related transcriptional regulator [Lentzea sp. BCCO 10_0061]